jgi:hypothetical protein
LAAGIEVLRVIVIPLSIDMIGNQPGLPYRRFPPDSLAAPDAVVLNVVPSDECKQPVAVFIDDPHSVGQWMSWDVDLAISVRTTTALTPGGSLKRSSTPSRATVACGLPPVAPGT